MERFCDKGKRWGDEHTFMYGRATSRRNWLKSAHPSRFPIGGRPVSNRSCTMRKHRAAPGSAPGLLAHHLANRETELTRYSLKGL